MNSKQKSRGQSLFFDWNLQKALERLEEFGYLHPSLVGNAYGLHIVEAVFLAACEPYEGAKDNKNPVILGERLGSQGMSFTFPMLKKKPRILKITG